MSRRLSVLVATFLGLCVVCVPAPAGAQSFGIGPRFSFVRGDLATGAPATRLIGGTMRVVTGKHTVLEATMDYRAYLKGLGSQRTRETPIQGSLLLFPVRSGFSPYVGGGIGLYTETHDTLGVGGLVTSSTTVRKVGWHLGAGAEIKVAPHAAFFADYRFRFVRFGPAADGSQPISVPGVGALQLSHQGSMWTSGVAFYF
jgi:hypothetical protein